MSLVVKLEDDSRRTQRVGYAARAVPPYPLDFLLLSGIHPFGKTVFNHLQMEAFLEEWDRVKDSRPTTSPSSLEAWEKVKHMAGTCCL